MQWHSHSTGLHRHDDRWGAQSITAVPCKHTPGNVFVTFSSGTGRHTRFVQFSLSPDDVDHLVNVIDGALGDALVADGDGEIDGNRVEA